MEINNNNNNLICEVAKKNSLINRKVTINNKGPLLPINKIHINNTENKIVLLLPLLYKRNKAGNKIPYPYDIL